MIGVSKLAITGGPCAGKSSIISLLKDEFGDQIITIPESATIMLAGGFLASGKDLDWSKEWQHPFQKSVLELQRSLERTYELVAQKKGIKLLICDNGLPSGAAYMPGGIEEFAEMYGFDFEQELSNYDSVLHLETIALAHPEKYGRHNNENRYTTLEDAIMHDNLIKEIWDGHPNRFIIPSGWSLEDKLQKVLEIVNKYL